MAQPPPNASYHTVAAGESEMDDQAGDGRTSISSTRVFYHGKFRVTLRVAYSFRGLLLAMFSVALFMFSRYAQADVKEWFDVVLGCGHGVSSPRLGRSGAGSGSDARYKHGTTL